MNRFKFIKNYFCKFSFQYKNLNLKEFCDKFYESLEFDEKTLVYKNIPKDIHFDLFNLFKTKEDYPIIKENLFNLIGHKLKIKDIFWDDFIQKSIDLGVIKENLVLMENHCFFHYFPHYNTTNKLIENFINEDEDAVLLLFKVLDFCSLIKLNNDSFILLEKLALKYKENEEINKLFDSIKSNRNN